MNTKTLARELNDYAAELEKKAAAVRQAAKEISRGDGRRRTKPKTRTASKSR